MFFSNKKKIKNKEKAFSLVELLVTISILLVVSGVVFISHSQFSSNVLLDNLAYEVSLAIRQAQSYGVQVKQSQAGSFDEAYGVFFVKDASSFVIFADIFPVGSPNFIYDEGSDEVVDRLSMMKGNKIETLCAGIDCNATSLSIAFLRPDPSAIIKSNLNNIEQESAEIILISPKGDRKKIYVNKVGQITVKSVSPN